MWHDIQSRKHGDSAAVAASATTVAPKLNVADVPTNPRG